MFEPERLGNLTAIIQSGGVVLYPTDTLWALGCDATNSSAVDKLLGLKKLHKSKGLVLLADSMEMIMQYADHVPPRIDALLMYHSRPLTVIYDKGINLPPTVLGDGGSVAFRLCRDPFVKLLISSSGKPLVATGACEGYEPMPLNFGNINSNILKAVNGIAAYRRDDKEIGEPSQLVCLDENGDLKFIRD